MADNWKFETQQIHAGAGADPTTKSRATPIYRTTAYVFDSAEHAANLLPSQSLETFTPAS